MTDKQVSVFCILPSIKGERLIQIATKLFSGKVTEISEITEYSTECYINYTSIKFFKKT